MYYVYRKSIKKNLGQEQANFENFLIKYKDCSFLEEDNLVGEAITANLKIVRKDFTNDTVLLAPNTQGNSTQVEENQET